MLLAAEFYTEWYNQALYVCIIAVHQSEVQKQCIRLNLKK